MRLLIEDFLDKYRRKLHASMPPRKYHTMPKSPEKGSRYITEKEWQPVIDIVEAKRHVQKRKVNNRNSNRSVSTSTVSMVSP